jgi:hypothetical protein
MNESNVVLDTKEAAISKLPTSLSDQYREKMGKLLDLTNEQKDRIKKWLKENINLWIQDTKELHERLQDDNDLVEGYIMETDFPWVDASNVHQPVTEIYMDAYRATEKRSILEAGLLWVAETDVDELRPIASQTEEMMNYQARNKWNIASSLPGILWTTNRDGLGVAQVPYVEDYKKVNDIILITNQDEFTKEFPTSEDAGISEEEYEEMKSLCSSATDDEPVEIPITYEKQVYAGPKVEIVDLVDFVVIPAWVPHIKDPRCRGYGKRYTAHIETIREKGFTGVFYEEATKKVIESGKKAQISSYVQAKDDILGIKRTSSKDERTLYELAIKGRLEDDGEIQEFIVTYEKESDELLQCIDYIYRTEFYALFVIDERPNQMVGKSVPSKTRDLNDLIDTQVNQEINIRTISTVPIFKGKKDIKSDLDPEVQQNKIRPGMIIWLDDFDSFDQFKVQPTDLGESAALQERSMRMLTMYMGMDPALSAGSAPSGDPKARGNKMMTMIQQASIRMEDPISFLRQGISDLGDICLSHVYQFGPPLISYQTDRPGPDGQIQKQVQTIHKKYLRKDIRLKMNAVGVINNPQSEMQKAFQVHQMLMTCQVYAQNPQLQAEVLRDVLEKGRINGRERYLPNEQKLKQMMVEIQKQAMQKMMLEKALQEKKAKEDQVKQNLAKVHQALSIKAAGQKMAEANLGTNGGEPT